MTLHPYMVWEGDDPREGAALVFAETARAAKKAGWSGVSWLCREDYTEFRVRRIRDNINYLMSLYDGYQVIDNPPTCEMCERWGAPARANGDGCENCGGAE